jgi:RNA polymerase sigma-70 factor, ECF subfamily
MQVVMNASQPTDIQLLGLMRNGDREAFAELYRRRHPNVYRFALQMGGMPDLAEDVTQEVFMTLMNKADLYDESRGSLNSFLLGVARNHVLRGLRLKRPFVTIDEAADSSDPAGANGQLDSLTRTEEIQSVQRAVLGLPEHYREVVVLCELQEMSYAETAAVLGCAIGTVRSRLHRARTMLIERLRPVDKEEVAGEVLKSERCFA